MQVIKTTNYGELTFIRTWSDGQVHIGKLKDGGFCHIGGPSIASKSELENAIPKGEQLNEALDWWENKDKIVEAEEALKIIMHKDGSYTFSDDSPITSVGDFVSYIPRGPALDAAILWYVDKNKEEMLAKVMAKDEVDRKTLEAKKELEKMTCVCGKICKHAHTFKMHQDSCKVHQAVLDKVEKAA